MQRVEIGDDFGKDYVLTKEQRDEYDEKRMMIRQRCDHIFFVGYLTS